MTVRVSVVIPNYNYGRFLREALDSALNQTYKPLEVVVVDDGSTDESHEILAEYETKGVKVIRQKNCGVGAARNTGAKASSGEVIAFLDADDIWFPEKLEKQVAAFDGDSELGLVSCGMQEFNQQGEVINTYEEGQEGWLSKKMLTFDAPVIVSGSAVAVRRDIFERISGFDERKELHPSEDWDFFYRVSRVSKVGFVKEILIHYRNHGDNGHLKIPRFENAMLLAYKKIFRTTDREVLQLRRKSYGNFYKVLAGSYLYAKQYGSFLRTTGMSLFFTPENLIYFASYLLRRLRRNGT